MAEKRATLRGLTLEPLVDLKSVTKRFGDFVALRGLTFSVERGSVLGLIGPNGSGKTTTLRLIVGLHRPDSGTLEVFGAAPRRAILDRIGYLPEERGLYRKMTVREVLRYYARLKGTLPPAREIDAWLDRVGIGQWASTRVEALSKGTAHKVQFVAAVLGRPELLVVDEPFSGLDPVSSEQLRRALLDLRREGTTIVLSTHDMTLAERMCDSIVMIHRGEKVLDGSRDAIDARFGDPTIKIRIEGALPDLEGVAKVMDFGRYKELVLSAGIDPQAVLANLVPRVRIQRFEVSRPSLHDLFLRLAGPGPTDAEATASTRAFNHG